MIEKQFEVEWKKKFRDLSPFLRLLLSEISLALVRGIESRDVAPRDSSIMACGAGDAPVGVRKGSPALGEELFLLRVENRIFCCVLFSEPSAALLVFYFFSPSFLAIWSARGTTLRVGY